MNMHFCFSFLKLDDQEFDLPPVEVPPTLESILNEVRFYALHLQC